MCLSMRIHAHTDTYTHAQIYIPTHRHTDIKNDLVVKTIQALRRICDCYLLIISQATTTSYIRPCVPVGLTTAGSTTKHTAYISRPDGCSSPALRYISQGEPMEPGCQSGKSVLMTLWTGKGPASQRKATAGESCKG